MTVDSDALAEVDAALAKLEAIGLINLYGVDEFGGTLWELTEEGEKVNKYYADQENS